MASIRKRTSRAGTTTYAVLFRHHGRQTSLTFETEQQAADFKSLVDILGADRALAEAEAADTDAPTLDEVAAAFFEWKRPRVRSDRTVADYERDYRNWIKPQLGHRRAEAIDEIDVQDLIDGMVEAGLSPKSVADRHMVLHSIYKWASSRTRRLVPDNPCLETELPKRTKSTPKGATPAEWNAIHAAAARIDPDADDLLLFLVSTGWRWSEAAALTGMNIEEYVDEHGREHMYVSVTQVFRRDSRHRTVIVDDAKSRAGLRRVRVSPVCAAMIRRRMVGKAPEELIFTTRNGGRWYQGNFLYRTWPKILEASGVTRDVTPHWLRHTHVAILDRTKKVSLAELQRRLGHENIQTTINVYGRMIDDVTPEALDVFDAILTGAKPVPEVIAGDVVKGELEG